MKSVIKSVFKSAVKAVVVAAGELFDILFRPTSSDNASITQLGTNGTNGTAYSAHVLDFDGSTGYVDTGQTTSFERTDTLEIDFWVNFDSFGSADRIITNINPSSPFNGFSVLSYLTVGSIQFSLQGVSNILNVKTPDASVVTNKWYHILITYDGSSDASGVSISINGVDQSLGTLSNTLTSSVASTDTIQFGAYGLGTGQFFDGSISNPSITINDTLTHSWEMTEGKESLIFDSVQKKAGVLTGGVVWVAGLSGLENSETHNGLPQNLTRKWNGYNYFDGTDDRVNWATITLDVGEYVEIKGYISATTARCYLFSDSAGSACLLQLFDFPTVAVNPRARLRKTDATSFILTHSNAAVSDAINTLRLAKISETSWDLTLNGVTENFNSGDAGFDFFFDDLMHDADPGTYFEGLPILVDYNGTVIFENANNTTGTVSGSPVQISIPEDTNSLGNDIFGNAITPSGDTFRADGLSDIDANVVSTLDSDSVINIVAEDVNIYESQAINTVYSNRDNTANQRGILTYFDASDRPILLLQRDTTTRVQVQSNVAISADDKVAWKSDGTGDASGVTIEINDTAVATTTLQDQDISGGITSAVNAQWFVDRAGTANKFKGTVTVIKVQ